MSKISKDKQMIEVRYAEASKDPIKYGIITSLNWYGNLNLTKLSKLINKHESTTFRYIKKLVADGLIEIDLEKTTSEWGKFYKLTPAVKKIYDKNIEEIENLGDLLINSNELKNKSETELNRILVTELLTKDLEKERITVLNYLSLIHSVQSTIMSEILTKREEFKDIVSSQKNSVSKDEILLKPSDFSLFTDTFKISKFQHLVMLYEVIFKFQKEIKEVISKIEQDMEQNKVPEEDRISQILHLFSANIDFSYKISRE